MKIALCLSGQPRFVDEGYHKSIKPFLDLGSGTLVKTFIHTWEIEPWEYKSKWLNAGGHRMNEELSSDTLPRYLDLYKPDEYIIEPNKIFCYGLYADRTAPGIRSDYGESMLYSIYQSNQLKSEYEEQHNMTFDVVIRCRTDVKFFSPIHFEHYDLSTITVPSGCPHPKGFADAFAFSNSNNMDTYCNLYWEWERYMEEDPHQRLCWEELFYIHLNKYKIKHNQLVQHKLLR